jgi:DUF4097 and DUF4098 domain-containing protein YvlB
MRAMPNRQTVRTVVGVAVALTLTAGATRAAAQDVDVRITISPTLAREIHQVVQAAIGPEVRQDVAPAIHDVVREVSALGLPDGLLRQNRSRDFNAEQTRRETKPLTIAAGGALELKNISGDVNVTAGAGRESTIELVYRSRGRTEADAKLGLSRVTVSVQQRGERTTVESNYPEERQPPYRVDITYTVVVPAATRVTASTTGGSITVRGIKGELSASSLGGNVTVNDSPHLVSATTLGGNVTVTGVESDTALHAETMGGNVTLQQIKARRVTASTIGGDVTARDIVCETAELGTVGGSVEYAGALSRNGRYQLHAQSGTVRVILEGSTGFELEASTFSGEVRSDIPLQVQGTAQGRGPRKSLHGTFGDGSAYVKAWTFSGSVIVSRKQ